MSAELLETVSASIQGGNIADVSVVGAVLAGLVSFLSPCVLPLVPGYVSMLSGIGMEQLRQEQPPRTGLIGSSLAFVAGFSSVFISFGASASAVGQFLRENHALLAPLAGALILMFGLHLLGWLVKLSMRAGTALGIVLVIFGFSSALQGGPLFAGFRMIHFFSFALIGFLGPAMARWLNRDVHLHRKTTQPGMWSGFLLGFAFAFGWTPCIGPILATVLALAAGSDTIPRRFPPHGILGRTRSAIPPHGYRRWALPVVLSALSPISACRRSSERSIAVVRWRSGFRQQTYLAFGKTGVLESIFSLV